MLQESIDRRSAVKMLALSAVPGLAASASLVLADEPGKSDVEAITIDNIRDYVVGVHEEIELADGSKRPAIAFDNAATTPALQPVLDEVTAQLSMYGSIGRGFSQKSDHSTDLYNDTRQKVLSFVGADPGTYSCAYVNTATDGLNKLASALVQDENTVVLATRAEHHANDLPWRERCQVLHAEVDEKGRIIYDDIERLLEENKVDYVTVTAASNVTGYVTDVHRVARLAHAHGAKIIVDGAQIVAHRKFSMLGDTPEENIDFMTFSAHKMYSPFGGGALIGLTDVLNEHMPQFYGGGIVRVVGDDWVVYKDAPAKYEAGSPNYPGVVGLGKAIDVLEQVGFDAIQEHEQVLIKKMIDGLLSIDKMIVYGDTDDISDRVGVVTFNHPEVNTYVLAKRLAASFGVATRRGAFCAHPYVWRLMGIPNNIVEGFLDCVDVNTAGMLRVSFGIYNTPEEVDEFISILPKAMEMALDDANHYSRAEPEY